MAVIYLDGILGAIEDYPLLVLHLVASVVTTIAFNFLCRLCCKKDPETRIYIERVPTNKHDGLVVEVPEVFLTGKGEVAHLFESCGQIRDRKKIHYRICYDCQRKLTKAVQSAKIKSSPRGGKEI